MVEPGPEYDYRYLGGIWFFNERDFFQAHEVWESLWLECAGTERRFYQGLIQAAVALYHFGNGNLRGALKLYGTAQAYMNAYPSPFLGLDRESFWQAMSACFAALLEDPNPDRYLRPDEQKIPRIELQPPPESWPDPARFEQED